MINKNMPTEIFFGKSIPIGIVKFKKMHLKSYSSYYRWIKAAKKIHHESIAEWEFAKKKRAELDIKYGNKNKKIHTFYGYIG